MPQFRVQISEVVTVILQKRISRCVNSENLSKVGLLQVFQKLWERSSLARRAVQPSTLTLWSQHAMWSSPRSRKVQQSLCASSSGVVINDGDDTPLAWRCESCRQSSLVDGVVRALRAADPASRISPSSLTATSAAAFVSSTKQWLLITNFI